MCSLKLSLPNSQTLSHHTHSHSLSLSLKLSLSNSLSHSLSLSNSLSLTLSLSLSLSHSLSLSLSLKLSLSRINIKTASGWPSDDDSDQGPADRDLGLAREELVGGRTNMSTTERGRIYEEHVQACLQPLFQLDFERIGGAGDRGIDLHAVWRRHGAEVIVQCKHFAKPLAPEQVREIMGMMAVQASLRTNVKLLGVVAASNGQHSKSLKATRLPSASSIYPSTIMNQSNADKTPDGSRLDQRPLIDKHILPNGQRQKGQGPRQAKAAKSNGEDEQRSCFGENISVTQLSWRCIDQPLNANVGQVASDDTIFLHDGLTQTDGLQRAARGGPVSGKAQQPGARSYPHPPLYHYNPATKPCTGPTVTVPRCAIAAMRRITGKRPALPAKCLSLSLSLSSSLSLKPQALSLSRKLSLSSFLSQAFSLKLSLSSSLNLSLFSLSLFSLGSCT
ncbi:uncharacterized protein MONBRDRAFT_29908 [Monosiga brevicollis MX1]|uniref:Restriction endonuclease type IV Mrr domain-containing protein n=1 Tax=Monosiga brevicollis TaxID=81824 RepID=A9VCH1_MONBE|nr:uncharacterized protein MONBRDRAFT_29908 [Monosiga brevicollis MX1]EDQ84749.1 predicted protein [Monosiga brevicollis MX1]|eukprot:XP_001750399.1 hypothetical protein [Monosiga brevicollis MX1]